ncbi:cerebellin-3-like [Ruditapes philippinarum]|uniref:cerebellin-3-like n=1 Tax=Ruditapes philippinarum TaxID=129788 RepID=UPI00295BAC4C|nr:cerebellin-3-like [Ruditapes philippinarum]
MAGYFVALVSFVIMFSYSTASEDDTEPACSKFKYDKQMLETMVKMEAKMNQWGKEKENFEENILSVMEHRKQDMKREIVKQNEKLDEMFDFCKNIREELKEKTSEKITVNNTTPKVAFNAYSSTGGSYGVGQSIIFPVVLLNEGGGYDQSTGIFTAPVAGIYHFSIHVCHAQAKYMVAAIVHEDNTVAITTGYENEASSCNSAMVPVKMETGERVYVKSTYTESILLADSQYRWPSFTGVLINV